MFSWKFWLILTAATAGALYFEETRDAGIWLGSILLFCIFIHLTASGLRQIRRDLLKAAIGKVVNEHIDTLARRRKTLIRIDHYGVVNASAWEKEVRHFLTQVIAPRLTDNQRLLANEIGVETICQEFIDELVEDHSEQLTAEDFQLEKMTPEDFEGLCSQILAENGWKSSLTKGSGDQGADVLAQRGKKKLVLQCKLYNSTVGNKAVQEVISAKVFYGAQMGAVVCVKGYSRSAKQLAAASDIALLTLPELRDFARAKTK